MRWLNPLWFLLAASTLHGADKPKDYRPWELPGPVLLLDAGYAIVEAEQLPLSGSAWRLQSNDAEDGSSPTGSGYMQYVGPDWQGPGRELDHGQLYQGAKKDWMIVRFWVPEAGNYTINVRNTHVREDGDNDMWIGPVGRFGGIRAGDVSPGNFSWLDWGVTTYSYQPGLHAIFTNGRSRNWGIDRVAIYREEAASMALDPDTPATPWRNGSNGEFFWDLSRLDPSVEAGFLDWHWLAPLYFDPAANPWAWSESLGWIHPAGESEAAFWAWTSFQGYLYLSEDNYPWLYRLSDGAWLYLWTGSTWAYHSATDSWENLQG